MLFLNSSRSRYAFRIIATAWRHNQRCLSTLSKKPADESVGGSDTFDDNRDHHSDNGRRRNWSRTNFGIMASTAGAACVLGGYMYWKLHYNPLQAAKGDHTPFGSIRPGLPTYTAAEVAQHKTREKRIWTTYKNGVYDVTDYIAMHPGGNRILLAAGGSMEPYWAMYAVHNNPEILAIAEQFRIGNILEQPKAETTSADDPYAKDPVRSPILIPSSLKPFNGEPRPELLPVAHLTPNNLFYIRNHLPVPDVKIRKYSLEVDSCDEPVKFTLDHLRCNFQKKTVVATVMCAGNRRSEMVDVKAVKGLNWGMAAIGNAAWSGVVLNELLKHSGLDLEETDKKHLVFEGIDKGPDGSVYGASIPIELARDLKNDIIIAYQMNGEPIPRDHGYPVRVIIPGVVGARQVKWLKRIYLSDTESESHWQRRDYKGFNSSVDWHNVDFDSSEAIMQLPVISAICDPVKGTELDKDAEEVTLRGYAWSGGGRAVIRVDVSADGGKTWQTADLEPTGQSQYRTWAWTLWEATIPLPKGTKGEVELVCKAVDVSYNVQPDSVEGIWNLRGVLSNAWHRVKVHVPTEKEPTTKKKRPTK